MSNVDKLLKGVEVEWKTLGEVAKIGTVYSVRNDEDEKIITLRANIDEIKNKIKA